MSAVNCERPCIAATNAENYRTIEIVNTGLTAKVDAGDFDRVSRHRWYRHRAGYVQACIRTTDGKYVTVLLHRFVMFGFPAVGPMVDHHNRDKFDCRRQNLRICNRTQNQGNMRRWGTAKTSRFHGVCRVNGKWRAKCAGQRLGAFDDEVMAAMVYDSAARDYFGEFALVNFPQNSSPQNAPASAR